MTLIAEMYETTATLAFAMLLLRAWPYREAHGHSDRTRRPPAR